MVGVKSKLILLLIVFIAVFSIAQAQLTHGTEYLVREGKEGDILSYALTFQNNGKEDMYISIFLAADMNPSHFNLKAGQSQRVEINYQIPYNSRPGTLFIKPILFDKEGIKYNYSVILDATILPSVQKYSSVRVTELRTEPSPVVPRETFDIVFKVNNPIEIEPTGTFSILSEDFSFGDLPAQKITKGENEYRISGLTVPDSAKGEFSYTFRIVMQDTTIDTQSSFTVPEFSTCTTAETAKTGIFGRTYSAEVSNEGTSSSVCTVSSRLSGLERYLVTQKTEGSQYSGNNIEWSFTLESGQTDTVSYKITYLPIILIPFVIILAAVLFWYFTRKMEIKKELVDYRKHAGFTDLKLQLHVKNLSDNEMAHVKIYDYLPAFVKEVRDYGTVPGSVVSKQGAKAVKWELDVLKPKEERVFSYKVRTSIVVLGKMNFPPAGVEYVNAKGEKIQETSNVLSVELN